MIKLIFNSVIITVIIYYLIRYIKWYNLKLAEYREIIKEYTENILRGRKNKRK